MFHWICPECGQEIAPGVKECPVCEPQASASSLSSIAETVAAVRAPQAAAAATPVALAEPVAVAAKPVIGPEANVILHPEVVLRPEAVLQAKAFHGPTPRVIVPLGLDAIPAEARPVVMPEVPLGTSPVELPDPLLEPVSDTPPQPETFADRLENLADLLHGERIPYTAPRIFQQSAAPGPHVENLEQAAGVTPVIVDVTFHAEVTPDRTAIQTLLAAPPSLLLLAEPQPPAIARDMPIEAFDPRPAAHEARSQELLGADLEAEPTSAATVWIPDAPNRGPAPALAPLQDYSETAERLMRPAEYAGKAASSKALPTVTLPGPALPRELMSLQAAGLVPLGRGGRLAETPRVRYGWIVKSVVVGMLLTAGVATYSMMPGSSTSAPPRPTPEPAPEPPVSARSTHSANSLARFVEVTGVRFMEVNKKPQIHYLVVNHSSAPLNSMTVYVTLHSTAEKPGQAPIARLTFRSPALAAFEAKEMFSSIERATAAVDLPDWQDLRADVDVQ